MEGLKACPFCGGKAYFRTTSTGCQGEIRKIGFQIECRDCRVSIPKTYGLELRLNEIGEIEMLLDERKKALSQWNYRGGEQP